MSDPKTMTDLLLLLVSILGTSTAGLLGKAAYNRRQSNGSQNPKVEAPKAEVPRAINGFMSAGEIETHCEKEQEKCQKFISAEIKAEFAVVNANFEIMKGDIDGQLNVFGKRLDWGDKQFKKLEKFVDELKN